MQYLSPTSMLIMLNYQGLPWFASSQVLAKIGHNLAIGATIVHVLLWYGKDIVEVVKKYRVC